MREIAYSSNETSKTSKSLKSKQDWPGQNPELPRSRSWSSVPTQQSLKNGSFRSHQMKNKAMTNTVCYLSIDNIKFIAHQGLSSEFQSPSEEHFCYFITRQRTFPKLVCEGLVGCRLDKCMKNWSIVQYGCPQ